MENPGRQSAEAAGPVEDPPPPVTASTAPSKDPSTSESLADSSARPRPMPALSPLTGCYLLIVIGEPHSERHKEIILQKIAKAFLSWDEKECHVTLEKELEAITGQSPEGEEARYGERLIQFATENLVTEILIHPQLNTLHQCMKNLLSSFTKHRHIIHAGYAFAGNGSWILQDGTLSISDLIEALHEPEVLRVLKAYENSVSVDIHCAPEGDWSTERFQREPVSKLCTIRINPSDVMTAGNAAISAFVDYLSPFLEPANIQQLLQPTDVVGNIRFTHPTLYVFPGGQGDAALFGINGFNMLIDGGFARKACFWDFARHLDRLDAVLLTRLNNSTVNGISAVLQRKKMNHVYPQIGHFFCNLQDRKIALSPDGDKDKDSLIVNLAEEGQEIVANLRHLALKPHPCYRDGNQIDPVNLYHKVGHGKLDMYVISPARDSQAVKEFLAKWTTNDSQLFSNTGKKTGGKSFEFPLQNLVSICALLVWQPANPNDTITRILFPGSTPQHKIFEGLEKLRHLEFLKHPVCSARNVSPSSSTVTVARSASKTRQPKTAEVKQVDTKPVSKPQPKTVKAKPEKTLPKEVKPKLDMNKLMEEKKETVVAAVEEPLKKLEANNKILSKVEEPLKKSDNNRILSKDEQIENIKKEIHKIELGENEEQKKKIIHRSKYDMRNVKSKVDTRAPSKSIDRKKVTDKKTEDETSPPATPKKPLVNGVATKKEKMKVSAKPVAKSSPSTTPAKSAKEANNRKVVEARVTRSSNKSATRKKEETPPPPSTISGPKTERKPISRRPKVPASPGKGLKTAKPPETDSQLKKAAKKPELDVTMIKAVGKKIAGPNKGPETEKTESKEKTNEKIESKKVEETEVIENKETDLMAVKLKPEKSTKGKGEEVNEEEVDEEDEEEEEEYLIVTKEESTEESAKEDESGQEEAQTKDETEGEGEIKKLMREEEESEKKKPKEIADEERETEIIKAAEKQKDKVAEKEEKADHDAVKKEKENVESKDAKQREVAKIPGDETPEGKHSDLEKHTRGEEVIDVKEPGSKEAHKEAESLPEEKISNTVETSATTAPTLPEDEKVEDQLLEEEKVDPEAAQEVVEEKYIQEKTKEERQRESPEVELKHLPEKVDVEESPEAVHAGKKKPRGVVKTPDEVADLPMHEEVDPRVYTSGESPREHLKKAEEEFVAEEVGSHDKVTAAKKDGGDVLSKSAEEKSGHLPEGEETKKGAEIASKYLNIIDKLEKSSSEPAKESPEIISGKDKADEAEDVKASEKQKEIPSEKEKLFSEKADDAIVKLESKKEVELEKPDGKEKSELQGMKETVTEEKSLPEEARDLATAPPATDKIGEEHTRGGVDAVDEVRLEDSGKSTLKDSDKILTGKSTLTKAGTEETGKLTLQDPEKLISEKIKPEDWEKESSGKHTQIESEIKMSDRSTPVGLVKEISGKTSPTDLEKETLGEISPKDSSAEMPVERSNEKTFSAKHEEKIYGKSTPHAFDREHPEVHGKDGSEKITSHDLHPEMHTRESSGRQTPHEVDIKHPEMHRGESSGRSTPNNSERDRPEIHRKESYARSAPHDLDIKHPEMHKSSETSGRTTPLDLVDHTETHRRESSGRGTPHDLDIKHPELHRIESSGTRTSHDSDIKHPEMHRRESSGRSTPHDTERDHPGTHRRRESSGRTTPHGIERDHPEIHKRKSSGQSIPDDLNGVYPEMHESKHSGRSTPHDVDKEHSVMHREESSGKRTLHALDRDHPEIHRRESSSRKPPNDLDTKHPEIHQRRESSDRTTSHDVEKDHPEKHTRESSGRKTPHEVDIKYPEERTHRRESSGRTTPHNLDMKHPETHRRESSGRSTPHDLDTKHTEIHQRRESSGRTTPLDLFDHAETHRRESSGRGTPHDLDTKHTEIHQRRESSGGTTPHNLDIKHPETHRRESSGRSTPHDLDAKHTEIHQRRESSGRTTPLDLFDHAETHRRESSGRGTPHDLDTKHTEIHQRRESSGGTTPHDIEKDHPEIRTRESSGRKTPHEVDIKYPEERTHRRESSGRSTPHDLDAKHTEIHQRRESSGRNPPLDLFDHAETHRRESSGRGTPHDLDTKHTEIHQRRESSGGTTPHNLDIKHPETHRRESSGRTTPHDLDIKHTEIHQRRESSGRTTPLDSERDHPEIHPKKSSGRRTPHDVDIKHPEMHRRRESSGRTTPHDSERDHTEIHTRESFGRRTHDLDTKHLELHRRGSSGKSTPHEMHGKEDSGRRTPQDLERDHLEIHKIRESSGRNTPHDSDIKHPEMHEKEGSFRSTPNDLDRHYTDMHRRQSSGRSTPHDVGSEHPETHGKHGSGKVTPHDSDREHPEMHEKQGSGKRTPHDVYSEHSIMHREESSGKRTLHDLDRDHPEVYRKQSSAKSTPRDFNSEHPETHGKEDSGRRTLHDLDIEHPEIHRRESSGKSTPHDLDREYLEMHSKEGSGRNTPHHVEREHPETHRRKGSGKITPHDLDKDHPEMHRRESSGKSTPHDLERELPETHRRESIGNNARNAFHKEHSEMHRRESSGKITPHDLDRDHQEMHSREGSGRSTPHHVDREHPEMPRRESFGKGIPRGLDSELFLPEMQAKQISGRNTIQELETDVIAKSISGTSTPRDLKQESGKSSPFDAEKSVSGKSTPQDLAKQISGDSSHGVSTEKLSYQAGEEPIGKSEASESGVPEVHGHGKTSFAGSNAVFETCAKFIDNEFRWSSREIGIEMKNSVEVASGKSTPVCTEQEMSENAEKQSLKEVKKITESLIELDRKIAEKTHLLEIENQEKYERSSRRGSFEEAKEKGHSESPKESDETTTSQKKSATEEKESIQRLEVKDEVSEDEGKTVKTSGRSPSPSGEVPTQQKIIGMPPKETPPKVDDKIESEKQTAVIEKTITGPPEVEVTGMSNSPSATSGKISSPPSGITTSDSISKTLTEKQTLAKSSSPSPVNVSPPSVDEVKGSKEEKPNGKRALQDEKEDDLVKSPTKQIRISGDSVSRNHLDRLKYEAGDSSRGSTPERSTHEKSDTSGLNGIESEEEMEKGILESEKREKESQILDVSSEEEEELKALGVDDEDVDSETEMKKEKEYFEESTDSMAEGSRVDIRKGEKEDINQLVKTGVKEVDKREEDSDQKSKVKRMLITASSEDGGAETEICIQDGVKTLKEIVGGIDKEEKSSEEEFSNLISEARKEYITQRSRKTSCNSSAEDLEDVAEEIENAESEKEELGTLLMQARQELALVRSKGIDGKEPHRMKTKKTTKTTETTETDDNDEMTVVTVLTEEREEQEDGSIRVTTTKETTTTKCGENEETTLTIKTDVEGGKEIWAEESEEDIVPRRTHSSASEIDYPEQEGIRGRVKKESESKVSQADETSRRTSASSIISQEDMVARKDSSMVSDVHRSSSEMSPLKTTYITSHGDSESLMTSSFYGNLPTEDEKRAEHLRAFRKGRGYESFTEVGPNGERTERTYFYEADEDDPERTEGEKSRFVKAFYTKETEEEEEDQKRFDQGHYSSGHYGEETRLERTQFVQRFYTDEESEAESEKYRLVTVASSAGLEEKLDFARAVDEHVSVRGEYLGREFQKDFEKYAKGKPKSETESEEEDAGVEERTQKAGEEGKKDVVESWGKPLGLPLPPKNLNKAYASPGQNISTTSSLSTPSENSDSITNWGQPMSLPSPAPPLVQNEVGETVTGGKSLNPGKETPKKEKLQPKKSGEGKGSGNNTPNRRSESPVKQSEKRAPSVGRTNKSTSGSHLYLDLTYVPHHGNSYYINVEFFKKVRARYYVFSGTEPSKEVYNALLEAKQTWEDKKLEVTIIPTYDTDVLGYWVAENEEILAKHKIDLSPSASRCTINLQDHETSCSAYRLEF